ncbi:hypothetical protein CSUB01_12324 [Colletotrichum sublineola]|uniref:Uncharacterized protein n=1 Tax=Colletotrichum sublineola TaxID=1173701 RepID=A0A066Y1B0_COLSU|nr:hypothetical protein CSUB01_12324 [Colletotrichum sublineola]
MKASVISLAIALTSALVAARPQAQELAQSHPRDATNSALSALSKRSCFDQCQAKCIAEGKTAGALFAQCTGNPDGTVKIDCSCKRG